MMVRVMVKIIIIHYDDHDHQHDDHDHQYAHHSHDEHELTFLGDSDNLCMRQVEYVHSVDCQQDVAHADEDDDDDDDD